MSYLPAGIQHEFDAAVQRTGWTRALRHAYERVPVLLSAKPWELEVMLYVVGEPYDENKSYDELDITETVC